MALSSFASAADFTLQSRQFEALLNEDGSLSTRANKCCQRHSSLTSGQWMENTVGRLVRTPDRRYQIAEGGRTQESSKNDCGADATTTGINEWSALMRAASGGQIDVVRFLVNDCGTDVNTTDKHGKTALMQAADEGQIDVNNYGWTALMKVAAEGYIDMARCLINEGGADVNTKNDNGETALFKATCRNQIDMVRFLVNDCHANVNDKNENGYSVTRLAADHGYYDIVRLLTPFVLPDRQTSTNNMGGGAGNYLLTFDRSSSSFIPPFEMELGELCKQGEVGGDFRAKWLDADAAVKLFIPDASHSTFEREAGSDVNFFVCEYASQGSLTEYANTLCEYSFGEGKPPSRWKYLHGAALGLAYLHERGIIHGDLRCSNILIGSDGLAKVSNFGLTESVKESNSVRVVGSIRWQSPEVLKGYPPSRESDVYSLGMCILEAESGQKPWSSYSEGTATYFVRRSRELVWRMCCQDPHKRPILTAIVSELEQLAFEESSDELKPTSFVDDYLFGQMKELWVKLQTCMNECENIQHRQIFDKLTRVYDHLQESKRNERLLDQFYSLLTDAYQTVTMTPEQAQIMRLSSTRPTTTSIYSFIGALMHS
ncbi:hypothetical protein PF002_g28056 [Phytophthora fragariae]|uniref:Protein kinase domain-containing protein n=1 Tax=Phytophthora fragariae TaxID=53985 RepID=A0A6A3W4B2_9STRA|nr:hypothetical protein PF002_g28056 [Phytophthora fragariae]